MATKSYALWIALSLALGGIAGEAQPVSRDKRVIHGLEVFGDLRNESLFYYAPGNLHLAYEPNGKPRFQLLEMRYTGSSAYADSGEKRFMNVVQFTVAMDRVTAGDIRSVQLELGAGAVLKPLPVRFIEAILVAPIQGANAGGYKRIGKDGAFHADDARGNTGKSGYWTERTFTLKLENHEAQLLWDQVENGQLSLSLGYSVYADIVPAREGDLSVGGNRAFVKEVETETRDLLVTDTTAVLQMVKADAFPIRVDITRWPDAIKKVDINEGIPPAYAALEVRCYDFSDNLRPDLAIKSIEIQATGVGGRTVTLQPKKFINNQPDIYAIPIRFPYAVKLTEPFRYRVTEYTLEGARKMSDWVTNDSWVGVLDITTPEGSRKFERQSIEVEIPSLDEHGFERVDVFFLYTYRGEQRLLNLAFDGADTLPVQMANIRNDKDTDIYLAAIWYDAGGKSYESGPEKVTVVDDYIYLPVPDKKLASE